MKCEIYDHRIEIRNEFYSQNIIDVNNENMRDFLVINIFHCHTNHENIVT
jgi:hypothetical protein